MYNMTDFFKKRKLRISAFEKYGAPDYCSFSCVSAAGGAFICVFLQRLKTARLMKYEAVSTTA